MNCKRVDRTEYTRSSWDQMKVDFVGCGSLSY